MCATRGMSDFPNRLSAKIIRIYASHKCNKRIIAITSSIRGKEKQQTQQEKIIIATITTESESTAKLRMC